MDEQLSKKLKELKSKQTKLEKKLKATAYEIDIIETCQLLRTIPKNVDSKTTDKLKKAYAVNADTIKFIKQEENKSCLSNLANYLLITEGVTINYVCEKRFGSKNEWEISNSDLFLNECGCFYTIKDKRNDLDTLFDISQEYIYDDLTYENGDNIDDMDTGKRMIQLLSQDVGLLVPKQEWTLFVSQL